MHIIPPPVQVASDQVAQALKVRQGAMIQAVPPNSAAAKAGLLPTRRGLAGITPGDVIVKVDQRVIAKAADLTAALEDLQLGDKVMCGCLCAHSGCVCCYLSPDTLPSNPTAAR